MLSAPLPALCVFCRLREKRRLPCLVGKGGEKKKARHGQKRRHTVTATAEEGCIAYRMLLLDSTSTVVSEEVCCRVAAGIMLGVR